MRWVWKGVFFVSALISVFFSCKALSCLKDYFSLNGKSQAQQMEWNVIEKGPASFALSVSYQFEVPFYGLDKKSSFCRGKTELAKPYFLNAPSATKALKELSERSWEVYYREKDPSMNALQKLFPFKECIHAFLTLGVAVYFFFLKKMVHRFLTVHEFC